MVFAVKNDEKLAMNSREKSDEQFGGVLRTLAL